MKFALLKASTAVLVAAASALMGASQAAAATDITYDCEANSPLGPQYIPFYQTVDATAPTTVAPGGTFDVVVDPATNQVPTTAGDYTVKNVNTFTLTVPIPPNATLTGLQLTGGSNLGSTPTWSVSGGIITIKFAGPIAGGATFDLPTITAHLTAGSTGVIETTLNGTSYTNPGLTFNTVVTVVIFDVSVPTSCFPNPNPVLTSTTIT
jgi:dehydratase